MTPNDRSYATIELGKMFGGDAFELRQFVTKYHLAVVVAYRRGGSLCDYREHVVSYELVHGILKMRDKRRAWRLTFPGSPLPRRLRVSL